MLKIWIKIFWIIKERIADIEKQDDGINEIDLQPRGKMSVNFKERDNIKEFI